MVKKSLLERWEEICPALFKAPLPNLTKELHSHIDWLFDHTGSILFTHYHGRNAQHAAWQALRWLISVNKDTEELRTFYGCSQSSFHRSYYVAKHREELGDLLNKLATTNVLLVTDLSALRGESWKIMKNAVVERLNNSSQCIMGDQQVPEWVSHYTKLPSECRVLHIPLSEELLSAS